MAGWIDPENRVLAKATALAGELADPVRLTALQLLAAEGPHTLTQLADAIGVSASRLGNHLGRLRASGLVAVERSGRHALYRVADAGLSGVLAALSRYAGADAAVNREPSPADIAHTCYDHAAGRLGVVVFSTLVERGALRPPDGRGDEVALGPDPTAFAELGVDPDAVAAGRRKRATACLDRTHRLPHLGGALGSAVLDALLERGLVRRRPEGRVLDVLDAGELTRLLPAFG
ncbi:DNA-binding transcriptional ArsR family regulator [Saccharothrix coeruleofusca]|uniref:ArsR/SmtB family transcription factor n=1 Tax=Saccharothrix coeruleofusca TaxID=33919 RepID=UPI001AE178B0|nr:metalloregulator ArsR/SmtB family transcription factor [Saccharothrix coeruleofusca]MBP2336557.1 DNA-binding transcriptional ArsR family regulator [Saccharothrix coeruleofusca]